MREDGPILRVLSAEIDMRLGQSFPLKRLLLGDRRKSLGSLLLGAGMLLLAGAMAQAADRAIPSVGAAVSYAGVCNVYGDGFFYIPGTDSCLKIGGLVYGELQTAAPSYSVNGQSFEANGTPKGGGYGPG